MTQPEVSVESEPTALYEIRFKGAAPDAMQHEFPRATVFTTRTETILFRQVEQPADLDELIDQLLSRGFVLTEVHEVRPTGTSVVEPQGSSSEEGLRDGDNV
jgi:hypothetical protein